MPASLLPRPRREGVDIFKVFKVLPLKQELRNSKYTYADLNDPPSLVRAVAGSHTVFAVTNCKSSVHPRQAVAGILNRLSLGTSICNCGNSPRKSYSGRLRCSQRDANYLVVASKRNKR